MSRIADDVMMQNALIAQLHESDRERLAESTSVFELEKDETLQRAGEDVIYTWFPCGSALASFTIWIDDRNSAVEVAVVGREGAVGGIVSNGSVPAFATSQVRVSGRFLRIKTSLLEGAKSRSIALRHWFSRYSDCMISQIFQTAACNATHSITERSAKWLLAAKSRTSSSVVEMTQEQLAETLGVSRTFINRTIGKFKEDGIVDTKRGAFIILNADALRKQSCDCTAAIESHFETVLKGVYPTKGGK